MSRLHAARNGALLFFNDNVQFTQFISVNRSLSMPFGIQLFFES